MNQVPNRIIKESICTSEDIAKLTPMAEILFYRLMVKADDYGAYYGNESIVKSTCFPLKSDDIKCNQVQSWINELVSANLIYLYRAEDGRNYIQFVKWEKHQQIRAKKRKFPEPDVNGYQLISDDCNCPRNPIQSNPESNPNTSTISYDMVCSTDVQRVLDAWNGLGLGQIRKIVPGTQREQLLKKRIKDYGVDEVLRAVENVKKSKFLNGNNAKGWIITFDWFIKPNNFPKVLDGNYRQTGNSGSGGNKLDDAYSMIERWAQKHGNGGE